MKKLLLAGGDRRALCLAQRLETRGFQVETMGLRKGEAPHPERADAVLFPYPFSVKNGRIPMLTESAIKPEDVLDQLRENTLLIVGRGMEGYVRQDLPNLKRYTDAPLLEKRNAELSAEAAVCEAMQHSPLALMDTQVLITGYGLFGRALALRLKALGAKVWIAARREKQRMEADSDGMRTVSIIGMADILLEMNLIFNTVPARIFAEYHLKQLPKHCRLLELASAPGGFDPDTAAAMGVACLNLPGLPALYSPESAALALEDAVIALLGEEKA